MEEDKEDGLMEDASPKEDLSCGGKQKLKKNYKLAS